LFSSAIDSAFKESDEAFLYFTPFFFCVFFGFENCNTTVDDDDDEENFNLYLVFWFLYLKFRLTMMRFLMGCAGP